MKNKLDSLERLVEVRILSHISLNKMGLRMNPLRPSAGMGLGFQKIKDRDVVTCLNKKIGQVRTDQTCAARDEGPAFIEVCQRLATGITSS